MIYFVVPLILTNLMQQLYTLADTVVVGKFSPSATALGAIGSSGAMIAFLTALFAGFSAGTAAVVSRDFGAKDYDELTKSSHTSLLLTLGVGLAVGAIGIIFARPLLVALGTKEVYLNDAVVYMVIRCTGLPFLALYSSASSTLRSVGNSKTPLYILTLSGIANVLFNLVFILCFKMGADGVAYATVISQILSALLVLLELGKRRDEPYALKLSYLRVDKRAAKNIMKFAIPGTVQGSVAHVMNVFLVAAANTFPAEVIEARTVASNIDNVLSTVISTYLTVTLTFAAQNRGAEKPDRMKRSLFYALIQSVTIAVVAGQAMLLFREPLIRLFVNESTYDTQKIMQYASIIMGIIIPSYIISAFTNCLGGFIKGLGHSIPSMVVSLFDMGVVRAVWIFVLFPLIPTLEFLYYIYPVSWGLNLICYAAVLVVVWRRYKRKLSARLSTASDKPAVTESK